MQRRKRIAAIIVCAANSTQGVNGSRTEYWRNQVKKLKIEIQNKKVIQPMVSTNLELTKLTVEASKANQAIETIQTICRTNDVENLRNTTKMTYRRQLRASHLQLLEKMRNINDEIREKQNVQLQW
jgi:hypothetical protein